MELKIGGKIKFKGVDHCELWAKDLKENEIYTVFCQSFSEKNIESGNALYIKDEICDEVSLDNERRVFFELIK